jgi:hypothetical protein
LAAFEVTTDTREVHGLLFETTLKRLMRFEPIFGVEILQLIEPMFKFSARTAQAARMIFSSLLI